jgi:uncharacterized protein YdiU (UPF0061 family)
MALNFLTIQAMCAECEPHFSSTGQMVTGLRTCLDVETIGMCQVLRSWHRARSISSLKRLFISPDEEDEAEMLQQMSDEEISKWATAWLQQLSEEEAEEQTNDGEEMVS